MQRERERERGWEREVGVKNAFLVSKHYSYPTTTLRCICGWLCVCVREWVRVKQQQTPQIHTARLTVSFRRKKKNMFLRPQTSHFMWLHTEKKERERSATKNKWEKVNWVKIVNNRIVKIISVFAVVCRLYFLRNIKIKVVDFFL